MIQEDLVWREFPFQVLIQSTGCGSSVFGPVIDKEPGLRRLHHELTSIQAAGDAVAGSLPRPAD
jgi:hypothetical protein